jgi:hypothetical protein
MNTPQRKFVVVLVLGIAVCSAYLLATASPWLLVEPVRSSGFPLGTLVAWAGIASLPTASLLGFHQFLSRQARLARASRTLMIVLLVLCACWGFVSYALAGNWAFNFSDQSDSFQGSVAASELFRAYSLSIVVMTLLASAAIFAMALFSNRKSD